MYNIYLFISSSTISTVGFRLLLIPKRGLNRKLIIKFAPMRQWLILSILILISTVSAAQATGVLSGQIKSTSGKPIFNVQIIIYPTNQIVLTDSLGYFSIKLQANKLYQVSFNHINFVPYGEDVKLNSGEKKTLNIKHKNFFIDSFKN